MKSRHCQTWRLVASLITVRFCVARQISQCCVQRIAEIQKTVEESWPSWYDRLVVLELGSPPNSLSFLHPSGVTLCIEGSCHF
jgi:hypothetical protein